VLLVRPAPDIMVADGRDPRDGAQPRRREEGGPLRLDACGLDLASAGSVVGTSGTIKTLAAGLLDLPFYDRDRIDGSELAVDETLAFVARLRAMTVAERRALPYMHPGRADVIGAGALIWSSVLERVRVSSYLVSEADILYGIARRIG